MNDPEEIFGSQPQTLAPFGARFPEYVFRQTIGYGLKQLREHADDTRDNPIDELFRFTGPATCAKIKTWLKDNKNIFLDVNYPNEDVSLPLIAVVNEGEREDVSNALIGDETGFHEFGIPSGDGTYRYREARAIPMSHTTTIYVTTQQPDLTLYLYHIVRFILLDNKLNLANWYDIHNLTIAGQALSYDEKFLPAQSYTRTVQLQYLTMFDYCPSQTLSKILAIHSSLLAQPANASTPIADVYSSTEVEG